MAVRPSCVASVASQSGQDKNNRAAVVLSDWRAHIRGVYPSYGPSSTFALGFYGALARPTNNQWGEILLHFQGELGQLQLVHCHKCAERSYHYRCAPRDQVPAAAATLWFQGGLLQISTSKTLKWHCLPFATAACKGVCSSKSTSRKSNSSWFSITVLSWELQWMKRRRITEAPSSSHHIYKG